MRQPDNEAPGAAAPAADDTTAQTAATTPTPANGDRTGQHPSPAAADDTAARSPGSDGGNHAGAGTSTPSGSTPDAPAEAASDRGPGPEAPSSAPADDQDDLAATTELPKIDVPDTEAPSGPSGPVGGPGTGQAGGQVDRAGSPGRDTGADRPGTEAGDQPGVTAAGSAAAGTDDDQAATTELPKIDVPDNGAAATPPAPPSGRSSYPVYQVPTAKPDAGTEAPAPTDATRTAPTDRWAADRPTDRTSPYQEPTPRRGGAYAEPAPTAVSPTASSAPTAPGAPPPPTTAIPGTDERPRHLRSPARAARHDAPASDDDQRRRQTMLLALVPVVLLFVLLVAWAVDTAALSGQVVRNVEVAGRPVGGLGEASVPDVVGDVAEDVAQRQVVIQVPPEAQGFTGGMGLETQAQTYEVTAEALGLTLDQRATVRAALDVGRDDPIFIRPFKWVASFFTTREVPLQYSVSQSNAAATLQLLQGDQRTQPTEPTIQLTEQGFVPVEGRPGTGLNPEQITDDLLAAFDESTEGRITIDAQPTDIEPYFSQADVEELANRANEMTANGLTLKAADHTVEIPPEQLRQWITPTETEEGGERHLDLAFNTQAAQEAIPGMFSDLSAEPVNARVALQGGAPTVVPGQNGVTCCGEQAGARVWEALEGGQAEVELETQEVEPEHTTEEVQGWGITEPIGGARAHRNGQDVAGPAPGFTTYYDPGQPRVTNIRRIAELTNGAVIAPGETFSLNEHVGERTPAKGFVAAGAIRDGRHVDEIGGGVSQFFTTLFNAAFFAGLDIEEYQAHSENFTRYPDGREATGGYPNPDLVIHNNTPHGVLIATSSTDTSVTVTLWSTPYATAEQTGLSSSNHGQCVDWVATRTRTYPDGSSERDSFTARYRPGDGINCEGQQINPPPPGG